MSSVIPLSMPPISERSTALLERLLDGLDVQVEPLVVQEVRGEPRPEGWGAHAATVHCTQSGATVLELAGGATLCFERQRVSVLPADRRGNVVTSWRARQLLVRDPEVFAACGAIRVTYQGSIDLFDQLREPLEETVAPPDPLCRCFEELRGEIAARQPGSRAMVEALLRRVLILLLRRSFAHAECRLSWLPAVEDARLGRAIAAMHDRPEHAFTLMGLAEVAGMSRSVFAARFAEALGQSPREFLKALRLARAAHLLTGSDLPVKSVAARVGYSSRSSFTRAFLARHGVDPTAFRKSRV